MPSFKDIISFTTIFIVINGCSLTPENIVQTSSSTWLDQFSIPAMILVITPYDCIPCQPTIKIAIDKLIKEHGKFYSGKYIVTPGIRKIEVTQFMRKMNLSDNWTSLSNLSMYKLLNESPESVAGAKMYLIRNRNDIQIEPLRTGNLSKFSH